MIAAILFILFFGIIYATRPKNKKVKKQPNPFLKQPVKTMSIPNPIAIVPPPRPQPVLPTHLVAAPVPPPLVKPNPVALDLATKYFGYDWRQFNLTKVGILKFSDMAIQTQMALAYQKMEQEDLKRFLFSLINYSNAVEYGENGLPLARKNYIYTNLHNGIFEMIASGHFNEVNIFAFIKQIAANFKASTDAAKIAELVPVPVPMPVVKTEPVGNDIIDIAIGDYKLNLGIQIGFTSPVQVQPLYPLYDPDDYKLGKKYKEKLKLSPQEVAWLNKFMAYNNVFNSIEGCAVAVIRLYLATIKQMVRRFKDEPVSLMQRLQAIQDEAYKFSLNQPNTYMYFDHSQVKATTEADLYYTVYKKAECAVRQAWHSGRNIAPAFHSRSMAAVTLFQTHTEPVLDSVIAELVKTIPQPDEETELALNAQSTTRWKLTFDTITAGKDRTVAVGELYELGRLNIKNSSLKHIYFEACKFMVPHDKIAAIKFYLHYISVDQRSTRIDNKPLTKTISKQFFKSEEQLQNFLEIINELILSKDLPKAVTLAESVYTPKRKTIILDSEAIERAAQQLSGTVKVLNAYLDDDEEPAVKAVQPSPAVEATLVRSMQVNLNPAQLDFLELFRNNSYRVPAKEIDIFVRSRNLFKSQLIENINDNCFEQLDDVLIEEEDDDTYVINPDYFKQILS
jgi:hypothetical protein